MTNTDRLGGRFTFPGTTLTVHRMGYGAMQLAGPQVWGPPRDPEAAQAVLREAIALGIDHIDTSDIYGPHVTNQLIRATLHPYPGNLVIVSKIGGRRGAGGSWLPALSPAEIRAGVEDNLRHLGLDAIDIVNLRMMSVTPTEGPLDKELAVLIDLKREGLVRHIGLSNVTARQVEQARALTEIVCVQNHYNLAHRGDDALIDALAKQGIAYVPFFPLGGFTPLQSSTLSEVANELGATPMQVALAWLLHRAPNILLIPGTSSVAHLRENVAAASLVLPAKSIAALDGIAR
ncbi:aldo/keto reductase family oxidoreductase [Sorangium sp. So ce315]|uniref:aldo/keto reductase family oxidoreductase n=1 Tax=Sorangium sp. So ce315 TaxID=3133299 RepID=UPI003F61FF58